ncbi:MAG: AraC family transcriptional regulator [Clostridiales bacterium]|nr:MAG: AraC family transcriptional regulator [Clostridiales bacterium]
MEMRKMDWISGLQRALDYVEEHITEPIDFEETAKSAYSSSFHFSARFSVQFAVTAWAITFVFRRLSLAGSELASTNKKVIDVALKYGYDSPDSFFARIHALSRCNAVCRKEGRKSQIVFQAFRKTYFKRRYDYGLQN